jgi:ABC-type transporter MlaC component
MLRVSLLRRTIADSMVVRLLIVVVFTTCLPVLVAQRAVALDACRENIQELVTLFSASSIINRDICDAAARHIDYAQMTEMAFKPAQWQQLTIAQRKEIVSNFRILVENRYYERWHKLFLRSRLTIASEAKAGSDTYVKTYLTQGKDEDTVVWRLHPKAGEPMVVNLNVNGKDLLERLSGRFQRTLEKRGPAALVAWMRSKADLDDDEAESAGSRPQTAQRVK